MDSCKWETPLGIRLKLSVRKALSWHIKDNGFLDRKHFKEIELKLRQLFMINTAIDVLIFGSEINSSKTISFSAVDMGGTYEKIKNN